MGRYSSFLLGNAFFVCLSRVYFIYFAAAHTCMCARVEVSGYASDFKHIREGPRLAAPPFRPGTSHGVGMLPCGFSRKGLRGEGFLFKVVVESGSTKRGGQFSPREVAPGLLFYYCPFSQHGLDFTGMTGF